ncbi:hypothetical protein I317_00840 [Kwoniella heveanensis CBS 569]|nr:hypothetical protein I317_00840 [Kwoniella heveanensis CBS 569]
MEGIDDGYPTSYYSHLLTDDSRAAITARSAALGLRDILALHPDLVAVPGRAPVGGGGTTLSVEQAPSRESGHGSIFPSRIRSFLESPQWRQFDDPTISNVLQIALHKFHEVKSDPDPTSGYHCFIEDAGTEAGWRDLADVEARRATTDFVNERTNSRMSYSNLC